MSLSLNTKWRGSIRSSSGTRSRTTGRCIAVASKDVAFFRSETKGSKHGRPAITSDNLNGTATIRPNISLAIDEEQNNLICA
ncbi:hypothetical protein COLO4_22381 [Corchorus olitorius]|uniref:Uncharacterized protein n=1 Tax=Corchorus olitorius TaxID=93759 RepID=A0A1R3IM56_9ROSI|nr:hypothetical protein COLO4_22381 [Corchorus olitorius]